MSNRTTLARQLLADIRECPALYPYDDPAVLNSPRPQLLAARVTAVRTDAVAWLWDVVLPTPAPTPTTPAP